MEGRCQCGAITFTTPLQTPLAMYICHCTECRHQSSSTYGMTAKFPIFDLQSPSGPGGLGVYSRPNSHGTTEGYFCTTCGSRLYHRHVSTNGEVAPTVSVKAGCLDGLTKEMMRGAVHIWAKSAVVDIPPDAEAYDEEPPGGSGGKFGK